MHGGRELSDIVNSLLVRAVLTLAGALCFASGALAGEPAGPGNNIELVGEWRGTTRGVARGVAIDGDVIYLAHGLSQDLSSLFPV